MGGMMPGMDPAMMGDARHEMMGGMMPGMDPAMGGMMPHDPAPWAAWAAWPGMDSRWVDPASFGALMAETGV